MAGPVEEAMGEGVAARRERLMEGLRIYGGHYAELSRRFAAWLGLHSTDAVAVLEIAAAEERGTPLSPARLSERIALSTGATTALLNRPKRPGTSPAPASTPTGASSPCAAARTSRSGRTSSSVRSPAASMPRCRPTRHNSWSSSSGSWPI